MGEVRTLAYGRREIRLRDVGGLHYLATLLREPEREALVAELSGALRASGEVSHAERARVAVTKAIKAALDRIKTTHPELGSHLQATVRRGTFSSYVPDPRHPIEWEV